MVDGTDHLKSLKYNIDEIFDQHPIQVSRGGSVRDLCATILRASTMVGSLDKEIFKVTNRETYSGER